MSAADGITTAIKQALRNQPTSEVLSVIVGNFVGLMIALVKQEGGDPTEEIFIDGGSARDVTIHAERKGGAT